MTAPSPAPGWPEATVERARLAVRAYLEQENTCSCHEAYRSRGMDDPQCAFHAVIYMDGDADIARAALSVLPDATADTVLLGKVREIVADTDVHSAVLMQRVANVLEGDHPDAYIGQVESDRQQVRNLVGEWFDDFNMADRFLGELDRSGFQIERKADAIAALLAGGEQ